MLLDGSVRFATAQRSNWDPIPLRAPVCGFDYFGLKGGRSGAGTSASSIAPFPDAFAQ